MPTSLLGDIRCAGVVLKLPGRPKTWESLKVLGGGMGGAKTREPRLAS